ncbi:hypothetical protein PSACC_01126 [Paramicrosporidium saccamoebae]|uniref:Protein PBN1 n=1 Tax=Paramicrosporidium saccamoebae TaxID=1246581 RepID=A0A2H9TN22_9FUNG|nr:hypothetical protein PSACC_01126 [Paramicrosporidium saccamoebae]
MTLAGYLAGLTTLTASIMFLLQPTTVPETTPSTSWWESFSEWVLHSHPAPSYAKLPLFGVAPDVILRAQHSWSGTGFHLRYKLQVEMLGEAPGCLLTAKWSVPKDMFVDQWLLHRATLETWQVDGDVDLEAPVYSDAAKSFTLQATRPLGTLVLLEIPDFVLRYQQPSSLRKRSSKVFLHPPKLGLECPEDGKELVIKVEEIGKNFRPLDASVPVAQPHPIISYATLTTVVSSLCYLLVQLYKS